MYSYRYEKRVKYYGHTTGGSENLSSDQQTSSSDHSVPVDSPTGNKKLIHL